MLRKVIKHLGILCGLAWICLPAYSFSQTSAAAKPRQIQVFSSQVIGNASHLHTLLETVGYEFKPVPELAPKLRDIGIKRLRLINVDHGENTLVAGRLQAPRLDKQLQWCRLIGADPHVIIGQGIPRWLSSHENNPKFGPKDWNAYENYLKLIFQHVILDQGFPNATWEVANEPDMQDAPVPTYPRAPKRGNEQDYQAYLNLYRHIDKVAREFEATHAGIKIIRGGPACNLFSFKHGDFNWYERFLKDTAAAGIRPSFVSFHYYGNNSSIGLRQNQTGFPPLDQVTKALHQWITQYQPGIPIWITEWGPSYYLKPLEGLINGNNVGAAWGAAFINEMLRTQVTRAMLLVTADLPDSWCWPALFHGATPKSMYFLFELFHKMKGDLLRVQEDSPNPGLLAARQDGHLTAVVWNFNWVFDQQGKGKESGQTEKVTIRFNDLVGPQHFHIRWTAIDSRHGFSGPGLNPQQVSPGPLVQDLGKRDSQNGGIEVELTLPPSSVGLLELLPD
jgi:hypothetical protein